MVMVSKGLDKFSENEELKGDELSGLTVLKPNALHLHITSTQNGNLKLPEPKNFGICGLYV